MAGCAAFMIHVEQLTKSFNDLRRGDVMALDHVSFEVQPGEIYGLLGPNGAGKTTCLRVLSTVLRATAGDATIAGYSVTQQPAKVRGVIGFMSNNTGIYDRMTAWEMVEYFGRLYGMQEEYLQQRLLGTVPTAEDAGLSRHAGVEDVDRHEAESIDRPDHHS